MAVYICGSGYMGMSKSVADAQRITSWLAYDRMLTYYGPGIQASSLLYLKNSQTACDADSAWFYVWPDDEEKNLAVTGGWRWPTGITFTTEEADELDEIAQNIPTFVNESFAAFFTGTKDINDDTVWAQYLSDLETYNLSRILEIRQNCYDRYQAH